jgi:nucleoside-diphosphate-sugar epimerase
MDGVNVLVTGGSGVIGQELTDLLVKEGANILTVDKNPHPDNNLESVQQEVVNLDQDDLDFIHEFEPEIIFHLAAVFERTTESSGFWEDNWQDNTLLTHRIIDLIDELSSVRVATFSSSYLVYNPEKYLSPVKPNQPTLIEEQSSVQPRNLCGASKYYSEQELEFISSNNPELRVVFPRIFRVYGQGSKDVISRWVRSAINGEQITLYNRSNIFDFIYSRDVAEGLLRLAKNEDATGAINLGSGRPRKVADILSIIEKYVSGTEELIVDKGVTNLYETSCADISKLVNLTGWRPNHELESGIKQVVDYESERR